MLGRPFDERLHKLVALRVPNVAGGLGRSERMRVYDELQAFASSPP